MARDSGAGRILHIATRAAWDASGDEYRGDTLEGEGFIHCSAAEQVLPVADRLFRGRRDLCLLHIDTKRVTAEIRWEDLLGEGQRFPHLYGPLERSAVVLCESLMPEADGRFRAPPGLGALLG